MEAYWVLECSERFSSRRILCLCVYPCVKYRERKVKRTQWNGEDILVVTWLKLCFCLSRRPCKFVLYLDTRRQWVGGRKTRQIYPGQRALVSNWMGPRAGMDVVEVVVTSALADIGDFMAVLSGRYIDWGMRVAWIMQQEGRKRREGSEKKKKG